MRYPSYRDVGHRRRTHIGAYNVTSVTGGGTGLEEEPPSTEKRWTTEPEITQRQIRSIATVTSLFHSKRTTQS